jgi:hypothetical protein
MNAFAKRIVLAAVSVLLIGAFPIGKATSGGGPGDKRDRKPPSKPTKIRATSATPSAVSLAWNRSKDNVRAAGYYVRVDRQRARAFAPRYTARGLRCDENVSVGVVAYDRARNRSKRASATVSTAACADTTPSPPRGTVTLRPVDGGANYYARFSNSLRAGKFPIGAWMECVDAKDQVQMDKAAGLNVYIGLCDSGAWADDLVRAHGMKVLLQQEEWLADAKQLGAETAGWILGDEIDMSLGESACAEQENRKRRLPADGRLRHNNFGKGVIFWLPDGHAACIVNAVDIPSTDIYWFSDGGVCTKSEGGGEPGVIKANDCMVAANYGWQVNRVRSLVNPPRSKPVWSFVELGCPMMRCTNVPQIRAAVWHSLIAGARGIEYFNHSFNGVADTDNVLRDRRYADVRAAVIKLNARIQSLRAVLDSPFVSGGFEANAKVRAMAKWDGSNFYVFAGTAGHFGPVIGKFSIRCIGNATARVLRERRSIPVKAGAFSDTFANPNAVHIYRIDGGSRCGLK